MTLQTNMTSSSSSSSSSSISERLERFFTVKTACDVDATMAHFAPDLVAYIDATLGWAFDSHAAVRAGFEQYMPQWGPPARSYATKILAGEQSALVHMVDTPELFGGELRILAAVDFIDGEIVRWVDYWDASAFDAGLYGRFRVPADGFPSDLGDHKVTVTAAKELSEVAAALQRAFADADASAAGALLHPDVAFVDMALRTQVVGRIETTRYLDRVLGRIPWGQDSTLRHVVGGRDGGGFEWTAATGAESGTGNLPGITAIELDADGLVTAVTSVYDSRQIAPAAKSSLLQASLPS
ncbi:nuclear transport factor 2 family protein [Catenulispora sp. GAS73]|uniref:nuclear transport factor 2 family protein n=1 Tax=Catenulispora sp. GAS73 TaxID=3156269 RepID=UPI00351542C4